MRARPGNDDARLRGHRNPGGERVRLDLVHTRPFSPSIRRFIYIQSISSTRHRLHASTIVHTKLHRLWWARWWAGWTETGSMALTTREINAAREGMHADGNGLYLRVQANGRKSWIFRFKFGERRPEMGLGSLADVPPVQARAEAARLKALVHSGVNPIEQQRTTRAREAPRSTTFKEVAASCIESHKAGWSNAKHAQQWINTLTTYAFPTIGDLPC